MNKSMADTNMKLKLELGNLRSDHDKLVRQHEGAARERTELTNKLTETSIRLRERETELKQAQARLTDAQESLATTRSVADTDLSPFFFFNLNSRVCQFPYNYKGPSLTVRTMRRSASATRRAS